MHQSSRPLRWLLRAASRRGGAPGPGPLEMLPPRAGGRCEGEEGECLHVPVERSSVAVCSALGAVQGHLLGGAVEITSAAGSGLDPSQLRSWAARAVAGQAYETLDASPSGPFAYDIRRSFREDMRCRARFSRARSCSRRCARTRRSPSGERNDPAGRRGHVCGMPECTSATAPVGGAPRPACRRAWSPGRSGLRHQLRRRAALATPSAGPI